MTYYNQLLNVNNIPRQIVNKLITFIEDSEGNPANNDNLFKLLKYNTRDALSQPITMKDKIDLFKQNTDLSQNGVIFQRFNDDTFQEKISQLRIFIQGGSPIENVLSNVAVGFDIVVHNELMILNNGDNRALILLSELQKSLNGMDIGLGILTFVLRGGFSLLDFNNYFQGYRFIMGTRSI